MRFIAIIPARYASSRFPGKPLARINEKCMIQWVYERVKKNPHLNDVYVATDDKRISSVVERFGGKALLTSPNHTCGTDRLAECVFMLGLQDEDIILNIQGDEPLVCSEMVDDLIGCFDDPSVYMGTLKKTIELEEELDNPNVVKVISNVYNDAIYFSRFCIPYNRDGANIKYYKHIGMYGYTAKFLIEFSNMKKTQTELSESLEQLRVLENGFKIRVKETKCQTIGVDTPEQIRMVEKLLEEEDV